MGCTQSSAAPKLLPPPKRTAGDGTPIVSEEEGSTSTDSFQSKDSERSAGSSSKTSSGKGSPKARQHSILRFTRESSDGTSKRAREATIKQQREIVYILGGSGVGKSTWVLENLNFHVVIDPDKLQSLCPLTDPDPEGKNSITYRWTKQRCSELLEEALKRKQGNYAIPGTGKSTASKGLESDMGKLLQRAKAAGFKTRLIHLSCDEEVAWARNATRARKLSHEVVMGSLAHASKAFEVLKPICDETVVHEVSGDQAFMRGRSTTGGAAMHNRGGRLQLRDRTKSVMQMEDGRHSGSSGSGRDTNVGMERIAALNAFRVIRKLGEGGYGKVLLCRKKDNKQLFAIKALEKARMSEADMAYVLAESEALQEIKHPFVMVMHGAFQDTQSFYFVLEYLPGGDLFEHVQRHCVFSVEWSRFYAAQPRLRVPRPQARERDDRRQGQREARRLRAGQEA